MSLRNALIMVVVLLVASAYLIYDSAHFSSNNSTDEDAVVASAIVTGLSVESVTQVEFKTEQTDFNLALIPSPADPKQQLWHIRETPNFALDPDALTRILDQLSHLQSLNFISQQEADSDLANYGLKNPPLVVKVTSAGGKNEIVLRFGERHKLSGRRYLQIEQHPGVYVVDEAVFKALAVTPFDLRERRPVRFLALAKLDGLTIRRKQGTLVFERSSDPEHRDFWLVSEENADSSNALVPQSMEADTATLNGLIVLLAKLTAVDFFDNPSKDLTAYGLQQPIVSLLLKPQRRADAEEVSRIEPSDIVITVGEVRGEGLQENGILPKREYYFQINGQFPIYRVEKRFFSDFLQGIHFFRNRQPLRTLEPEKVSRLSIGRQGQPPILLERTGRRSWNGKQADAPKSVDNSSLNDFLAELQKLTVLTYVEENTTLGPVAENKSGPELFVSYEQGQEVGALTIYGAVGEFATNASSASVATELDDAPRLASIRQGANSAIRFILGSDAFKILNSLQRQVVDEQK